MLQNSVRTSWTILYFFAESKTMKRIWTLKWWRNFLLWPWQWRRPSFEELSSWFHLEPYFWEPQLVKIDPFIRFFVAVGLNWMDLLKLEWFGENLHRVNEWFWHSCVLYIMWYFISLGLDFWQSPLQNLSQKRLTIFACDRVE